MGQLRVLGASGGIADGLHTTSFLLDEHTLLDGGTGVSRLSIDEMCKIDRLLLTHAHLDHISGFALMLATVIGQRQESIQVIAPDEVLQVLQQHLFNWELWPDFSQLPTKDRPLIEYRSLTANQSEVLYEGVSVEAVPLSHTVPSYAYILDTAQGSVCFCGDTAATDQLWERINALGGVDQLLVELSYPQVKAEMAAVSGHYTLGALYKDLLKLERPGKICLMHHKPGMKAEIQREVLDHPISQEFELLFTTEQLVIPVL